MRRLILLSFFVGFDSFRHVERYNPVLVYSMCRFALITELHMLESQAVELTRTP